MKFVFSLMAVLLAQECLANSIIVQREKGSALEHKVAMRPLIEEFGIPSQLITRAYVNRCSKVSESKVLTICLSKSSKAYIVRPVPPNFSYSMKVFWDLKKQEKADLRSAN